MTLSITANHAAGSQGNKGKVTCITCKLRGCVGKCRFQVVNTPQPPRAA